MDFEFEDSTGFKIVYNDGGKEPRCILSEIDAKVHGEEFYYSELHAARDPIGKIHEAGWHDYQYEVVEKSQRGQSIRVQLTDLFGASLYLCTIPKEKDAIRQDLYNRIRETLDVPEDSYYLKLLEQADWDLKGLFAQLKGACSFPEDPLVRFPDNKTLQFPLKLFENPYYKTLYEQEKQAFLDKYATDDRKLSLVAYPNAADKRTWKCIKEDCDHTCMSPLPMAKHLGEDHPEYHGWVALLATITYQTKKGVTKVRHNPYIIHKSAKRPRSAEVGEKPAKDAKLDAQLYADARLELALKLAADKDKQNDRLTATLEEMVKTQAEMVKTQAVTAATSAKLVSLLSTNQSCQGTSRNSGSLESAVETFRTIQAFQQMQSGPGQA